nr:ISAs1 family transposase [Aeromonas caviae]
MAKSKVQFQKGYSLFDFFKDYGTEAQCENALLAWRFPNGFICPECANKTCCRLKSRPRVLQCNLCRHQMSLTGKTIFANTKLPLTKWFLGVRWMQATSERTDGELIAIDGKTLRSSYDRDSRQSTIHMVSAFAAENRLVLGQVKTDEKSNEITAIPELLALLDIKGCLVSIDAMGCQTGIASTIVKGGGDYLLAVKGNQPTLHNAVRAALAESTKKPLSEETLSVEKEHGRIDGREYHVLPAGALSEQFPEWKSLKTVGVAISYRIENMEKFSMEYRYYISSAELTPEQFASAVRGHWAIENSLHWVLDVVMNEDACQIYRGDAPQILACARHMAQNMLRAETSRKASLRKKQQFAGMSSPYLEKVLDAGLAELKSI